MKRVLIPILLVWSACAQDTAADRVTVPFSDPARPKMLKCSLIDGSITVRGYDGKDVVVEAAGSGGRRRNTPRAAEGLRRIDGGGAGLSIEEDSNTVKVGASPVHGHVSLVMQVPYDTSVTLRLINGGEIVVERVRGEIDVDNLNGPIVLREVSGSVLAHSLNSKVTATLERVTPDRAMSFSSLNGDIDVTLPASTRASLKLKTDNGEIYSDFEMTVGPSRPPVVEDNRGRGGKYKVRTDRAIYAKINGGGPEMQFTSFNGRIYLRKAK